MFQNLLQYGIFHVMSFHDMPHCHDIVICHTWCYRRNKERKKERHLRQWKMKMRVASGGIRTHDTLYSGQMLYQLSYQGSSAGRVRIKHLIRLYEQANLTHVHVYCDLIIYDSVTSGINIKGGTWCSISVVKVFFNISLKLKGLGNVGEAPWYKKHHGI